MKFGSVKFYKRLIVACFVLIVLTPLVLAVVFGTLYAGQKKKVEQLEAINWALAHGTALPEDFPIPEDFYLPAHLPAPETDPAGDGAGTPAEEPSFAYQAMYPELKAQRPEAVPTEDKVCYLTFDDGPSATTGRILGILEDYGAKATFFVTGEASERDPEMLRRAREAGHTVAVHTYSHDYTTLYASPEAFLEDFARMQAVVTEATGENAGIFRFPGGSINAYNQTLYTQLIAEMTRRGYVFFDWNVAGNDAVAGGAGKNAIVADVLNGAAERQRAIVLLHDRLDNATTADALPEIIEGLAAQGFTFAPLTAAVQPITFFYPE